MQEHIETSKRHKSLLVGYAGKDPITINGKFRLKFEGPDAHIFALSKHNSDMEWDQRRKDIVRKAMIEAEIEQEEQELDESKFVPDYIFEEENKSEEVTTKDEGVQTANKESIDKETQTNTIRGLTEQLDRYKRRCDYLESYAEKMKKDFIRLREMYDDLKAEKHLGGVTSSKALEGVEELWDKENRKRKRGSDLFKEAALSAKKQYRQLYI